MSCTNSKKLGNGLTFCDIKKLTVSKGTCSICTLVSPLDIVDEKIQVKRVDRATSAMTKQQHEEEWKNAKTWAESFPQDSYVAKMLAMVTESESGCNCKKLARRSALIAEWKTTINNNKV